MKLSMMYCILSAYFVLSVLPTDILYTISNEDLSCENCFTINEVPTGNFSLVDRLYLHISPGRHTLSNPDALVFKHVAEVQVVGTRGSSEVACTNNSGIVLTSVNHVVMANLSFLHCGAASVHGASAVLLHLVPEFILDGMYVYNSTSIGVTIKDSYGVARIQDSVISGSPTANIVCAWGNLHSTNTISLINLTVENSAIEHGGRLMGELSGGLNIMQSKTEAAGNIHLDSVTFYNNSGYIGGNLNIVGTCSLSISIANSFISHGKACVGGGLAFSGVEYHSYGYGGNTFHHSLEIANTVIVSNQALEKGGGMSVSCGDCANIHMYNVTLKSNAVLGLSTPYSKHLFTGGGLDFHLKGSAPILVIDQSIFQNNFARSGAGLYISAEYVDNCTSITIDFSVFENNEADFGAAAMLSLSASHTSVVCQLSISSARFENNTAAVQASGILVTGKNSSFAINLNEVSFTKNRNSFSKFDRFPSTLALFSVAQISMLNCLFHLNEGTAIGARHSSIHVLGTLNISCNNAAVGAGINLVSSFLKISNASLVLFQQNHASEVGGAIYHEGWSGSCFYTLDGDIESPVFHFINNSAVVSGDVLYESGRSNCTVTNSDLYNSQFHSISQVSSQSGSLTTSSPHKVCLCQGNATLDCEATVVSFTVIQGAPLFFSVALTDQNGLPTPGYISITSANEQHFVHSEWNHGYTCSEIMLPVSTAETTARFLLFAESYHHSTSASPVSMVLNLLPCPSGFRHSEDGSGCDCRPFSGTNNLLQCNDSDFTFTVLPNAWIGHDDNGSIWFFETCPFNYCEPGVIVLDDLNNSNSVCAAMRSGVLCGKCSSGLSLMLGSDACSLCSDHFISLIVAFGALGILLLVVITLLSLIITQGTVNAIIFYAAFLYLNKTSLFTDYDNGNLFVIFISWLNLDFGFDVCFYDGLTSYGKLWLQFVFPIYLYAIEMIVIITSYQSSLLARVTGARSGAKIMSTVFLLGYMKLLRAVLEAFPYAEVRSPFNSSEVKMVWLYDGNIEYYSEHHVPILSVAVFFLVVISAPYTFSLLFVQVLQRVPYLPFRARWEGISDAHVGPFKEQYRFWLGLLLLSYTFLVVLYSFTGGDRSVNLAALAIVCSLLLLMHAVLGGIYKKKTLNILESLFSSNLVILSVLQLSQSSGTVLLYTLTTVAFVLILAIFLYHSRTSVCNSTEGNTKCPTWKISGLFATSNNSQVLSDDDESFETEYTNASATLNNADNEGHRIFDSDGNIELVPASWLPTNYPVPVYREHPDLLKPGSDAELPTHSDSSEKSLPTFNMVRSSYLVVDRKNDEVNFVEDPNNVVRLQRLSTDDSGDRMYVVEDNIEGEHASEGSTTPTNGTTKQVVHDSDFIRRMREAVTSAETSFKLKPLSRVYSPQQSLSCYKQKRLPKPLRKRSLQRKTNTTMKCKRPQSGSNCFKCDPSFFLQSKVKTFKVDRKGREYSINSHDITLTIPPAAIKEGHMSLDIEVAVMLSGPFVFPSNMRPISPILWICSRNKALLCKPIEITLPHFVGTLDGDESKLLGMQFMKASHYAPTLPDGTRRFTFDHIGTNSSTSFTSLSGKLKTLHFCFLCIAAPESRALYKRALYCLMRVDPIIWDISRQKQEIYFVLSYYMKTCLKVMCQLPDLI